MTPAREREWAERITDAALMFDRPVSVLDEAVGALLAAFAKEVREEDAASLEKAAEMWGGEAEKMVSTHQGQTARDRCLTRADVLRRHAHLIRAREKGGEG